MAEDSAYSRRRLAVSIVLALTLAIAVLQIAVVRPYLWPAGAGVALSGDTVFASLGERRPVPGMRPPDVTAAGGRFVEITDVNAAMGTGAHELTPGMLVTGIYDASGGRVDLSAGLPNDPIAVLRIWRYAYWLGPQSRLTLRVRDASGDERITTIVRESAWRADDGTRAAWLRGHAGQLVQVIGFLSSALVLVALGTRGVTASLMTLALIATGLANSGPLYGAEQTIPVIGPLLHLMVWMATPLAFPTIALAILHFPTRAAVLDRWWTYPALAVATAPMLAFGFTTAAFLVGFDALLPGLAWLAAHGWTFDLAFAIALAANVVIVLEGVGRYRANRDANERRRIQIVVYTGTLAVLAYAVNNFVPVVSSLAGRPTELPWPAQGLLQILVLLPAFALPYVVAVKRVFSPRTVLRQGLQYALARRTLSVLLALPLAAIAFALVTSRDRPLGDILVGHPIFYAACVALAGLGFRYRDSAARWLDQRFFRTEYDGREILVALARQVSSANDPRQLVALVISQIDAALHPESVAVLAGEGELLEVIATRGRDVGVLPRDGALATLLRWSDSPLEVFLDDDRSSAARLPAVDRAWLTASGLTLLVPVLAGTGDKRTLAGIIGLGQKRSEEPYTPEDRRLLSAIAAQMSVALDLSNLRRRLSTSAADVAARASILDQTPASLAGMPAIIDGKYRVDAVIGHGGMGAVFRAHDLRLARDVAVKVVRIDLAARPEARRRFEREAQIVASLQHPALVTVFDYGTLPNGAAYLVMEYVRGEDLRTLLTRDGPLDPERAIVLIGSIAAGIDFAHRAGVLHRDLKPENILLAHSGIGPKVVDFGIAKLADAGHADAGRTMTRADTIIGTPAYMAPEQLRGDPIDGRADVYSLAVMTCEMLTGRVPFRPASLASDIETETTPPAPDLAGVPPELARALVQALARARDERPATAAAFATSLIVSSSARS